MGLFYCLVVWAFIQAFDSAELMATAQTDPASMFFVAIERFVGVWASDLMYFLIMTSVLASQIAFHNAITRYCFNLARDGLLPAALAHTHPRFGSPSTAGAWQTGLAAVVIGGCALVGADPYLDVLLKVNTPGVVGIIALLALTSAAVVAYFVARRRTVRARATIAVAALATALLGIVLVVLVANINLLTGASPATDALLVGVVPAVFGAGLLGAAWLRRNRPEVYARIGAVHAEDGPAPAAEVAR
jgi:amino acid transporter